MKMPDFKAFFEENEGLMELENSPTISPTSEQITSFAGKKPKCNIRDHKRSTVRFTDEEYERIENDSMLSGKSAPELLKMSYFRGKKVRVLFSKEDTHSICQQLHTIVHLVNKIERRVSGGALEGWYEEFKNVLLLVSELRQMAVGTYGVR
jgi:hypothetical protein